MSSPGDFSKDLFFKARKSYICDECENLIPIGARYCRIVDRHEYEFYTHRLCMSCYDDWEMVMGFGIAEYRRFGDNEIWVDVEEAFRFGAIDLDHPLVKKWRPSLIEEFPDWVKKEKKPKEKPVVDLVGDPVIIPFSRWPRHTLPNSEKPA